MTNSSSKIYKIKKGEKFPIEVSLTSSGNPIDLTNANIRVYIKDELDDSEGLINKLITLDSDEIEVGRIIDPENGKFTIRLNDEDYFLLKTERTYYLTIWWDIPEEGFSKVVSSNGSDYLVFMVCIP